MERLTDENHRSWGTPRPFQAAIKAAACDVAKKLLISSADIAKEKAKLRNYVSGIADTVSPFFWKTQQGCPNPQSSAMGLKVSSLDAEIIVLRQPRPA